MLHGKKRFKKKLVVPKEEINDPYNWKEWEDRIDSFLTPDLIKSVNVPDKVQRNEQLDKIREAFNELYKEQIGDSSETKKVIDYILDQALQVKFTELIFSLGKRIDDRAYDQVRPISRGSWFIAISPMVQHFLLAVERKHWLLRH